ncbi:CopL family metal-binding regulatory protein [Luteimonas sp. A534]
MRTHALPLQILLALALVLNGIGGAMAGVLAALPTPASLQHAAVDRAPVEPGQHADCADQDRGVAAAEIELPASDCHSVTGSDCGDSPQCRQACMHASVAMAPLLLVGVIQPAVDAVLHRLDSGHPAPMLPSAIRPPIA